MVDDPALLGLAGTSPVAVRRFAWLVGSCFAALSGMLIAPSLAVDAPLLTLLVFFAFGAAAIGAFSSLPLTYLGGIGVGVGAALATKILGESDLTGPIQSLPTNLPFVVLFVALLVVPTRKLVERGSQVVRRPLPPLTFSRRTVALAAAGGLAVALVIPHVVGAKLPLYITALAYSILFLSVGLLVRTSGQVSLCQIAFAAVGASTAARAVGAGFPWPLAVLLGGLVAVPIGALLAIPAIRLSGVYLAIATFGFGLVVQRLFYSSILMFGGTFAIRSPRPELGGLNTDTDVGYYHVVLAVTLACCALVVLVRRSRMGRLLRAFADSPAAVDAHGTNTNELKVLVFSVSAFMAGVAGGLLGPITGTAAAGTGIVVAGFDFSVSLLLITVLFVAGRQPILSAVLGSVLLVVIPGYATGDTAMTWNPIVFGSLAIVAALFGRAVGGRVAGLLPAAAGTSRRGQPAAGPDGGARPRRCAGGRSPAVSLAEPLAPTVTDAPDLTVEGPHGSLRGAGGGRRRVPRPLGAGWSPGSSAPTERARPRRSTPAPGSTAPSAGTDPPRGAHASTAAPGRRARLGLGRTFQRMELFDSHDRGRRTSPWAAKRWLAGGAG